LLILGAILSPLMAPVIGIALGTVIGSVRFFIRSTIGLIIGSLLVFGVGLLAGFAARAWFPIDLSQALNSTQLSWASFLLVAFGGVMTSAAMVRSERSAALPSVALAYGLYLPLSAAGIGLGSGESFLFPDGVVVFAQYLSWGVLLAAITFVFLGFRPLTLFGYTVGAVVILLGIVMLVGISGVGAAFGAQIALPTPVPTSTPTQTQTLTPTSTPVPPTSTPTQTLTPVPPTATSTPTYTITPTATPIIAIVSASVGGGAILRAEPGFQAPSIRVVPNGTLLQVLPDDPVQEGGGVWIHVRTLQDEDGWILQILLVTATPAPTWEG
jgi:cell division septation protein DedD